MNPQRIFKPPMVVTKEKRSDRNLSVFLAGTIDMGNSDNWQQEATELLQEYDIINPRRDDFDASQKQSVNNPYFKGQVDWEHDNLEYADIILMNFLPDSKSMITLYELGSFEKSGKLVVVCPKEYCRRGNVEITCLRNNIPMYETLIEAIIHIKTKYKYNAN